MDSFSLSTPRGDLRMILPAAIAAAVPAVAEAEEGVEVVGEAGGDSNFIESLSPRDAFFGSSGLMLGIVLVLAKLRSTWTKVDALRHLRARMPFLNSRMSTLVNDELKKFRIAISDDPKAKGERKMENIGGLSEDCNVLAHDFSEILGARDGAGRWDQLGLLREVGMTNRLANYWRAAGHKKKTDTMELMGLMLFSKIQWVDPQLVDASGQLAIRRSFLSGARDFDHTNIFRIVATAHERIGRMSRIRTEIFRYEIELVRSLHMLAAGTLWLERADYAGDVMDRRWSLYWARGALDEAKGRLGAVRDWRTDLFNMEGSALAKIEGHLDELGEEVIHRRRSIEDPPDDRGSGRIISSDTNGSPRPEPVPEGSQSSMCSAAVYTQALSPALLPFRSPVLSMV